MDGEQQWEKWKGMVNRTESTFQQQGNVSSNQGSQCVSRTFDGVQPDDTIRQLINSGFHKQTRRDTILESNRPSLGTMVKIRQNTMQSKSQTYTRKVKCKSRCIIQEQSSNIHRVVNTDKYIGQSMGKVGQTKNRFICNQQEQEITSICVTNARPTSMGSECHDIQIDQSIPIRLPSLEYDSRSTNEISIRPIRNDTNSPEMGHKDLVPTIIGNVNTTTNTSKRKQPTSTVTLRDIMQQPTHVESSCMEVIRENTKKQGFSESVANRIANNVRTSTQKIYKDKWNHFSKWMRQNNKGDALKATIPMIAEYLNLLFEVWELEISTIQGYRAAIGKVIKLAGGRDISEDPHLIALISNFSIERPFKRKTYPSWESINRFCWTRPNKRCTVVSSSLCEKLHKQTT